METIEKKKVKRMRKTQDIICRILEDPEISQAELARKVGLSRQRINKITKDLIKLGALEYKHLYVVKRLDRVE